MSYVSVAWSTTIHRLYQVLIDSESTRSTKAPPSLASSPYVPGEEFESEGEADLSFEVRVDIHTLTCLIRQTKIMVGVIRFRIESEEERGNVAFIDFCTFR